jgi:hypothetical protein
MTVRIRSTPARRSGLGELDVIVAQPCNPRARVWPMR